jgi:hypothetical protein
LAEKIGVAEAGIMLYADTDGKEERSAASGKNYEFAYFLAVRKSGKIDNFNVCCSYDILSATIKFSVLKYAGYFSVTCSVIFPCRCFQEFSRTH